MTRNTGCVNRERRLALALALSGQCVVVWCLCVWLAHLHVITSHYARGSIRDREAIACLGGEKSTAWQMLLLLQLPGRNVAERRSAAALAVACGQQAVPVWVWMLHDKDLLVRLTAAWALSESSSQDRIKAVPVLIQGITTEDIDIYEIMMPSSYALGRLGPEAEAAIPTLIDQLETDGSSREIAASTLGMIGEKSLPPLIAALERVSPRVPEGITDALSQAGRRNLPFLVSALNHKIPSIRRGVVRALWGIGPEARTAAAPALRKMLEDPDPAVRQDVRSALNFIAPGAGSGD